MIGNSMKKTGSYLLFLVSFLALIMTWEMKLLSNLGGIFVAVFSFVVAILMWLDAHESLQGVGRRDARRTEAE
ncbi:hypothetical protein GCM10008018_29150 [Paenibacillus marchantiophytorum]|uniref:Uncharacterized protein n=1 Tax=Paenibacillus marchantiophytorum TaxID=1619310 RepID=A0ABQ1EPQ3_9BACL|nr:hypothetical protein [Paenibacillus marchantiophytorum]GFZ81631.1 hypothetical protein GCM10008018_29150 [Paenibacillus marchantiophytorum]